MNTGKKGKTLRRAWRTPVQVVTPPPSSFGFYSYPILGNLASSEPGVERPRESWLRQLLPSVPGTLQPLRVRFVTVPNTSNCRKAYCPMAHRRESSKSGTVTGRGSNPANAGRMRATLSLRMLTTKGRSEQDCMPGLDSE